MFFAESVSKAYRAVPSLPGRKPTNHLDTQARTWLVEYLNRYQGAALIGAHDAAFLDRVVDPVIDLRDGRTTSYTGNYTAYQRQKADQIAQQAAAARRQDGEVAPQERFIDRFHATSTKARQVQSRIKALAKVERIQAPRASREVDFTIAAQGRSAHVVVSVTHLSHAYDQQVVLCDANLDLERGDKVVLRGANGSGKSTCCAPWGA